MYQPSENSNRLRRVAVLLLMALSVSCLASCARVGNWLWSRDRDDRPSVDAGLLESADGLPKGDYEYDPAKLHSGTGIHYGGQSGHENRRYCVIIDAGHQLTGNYDTEPVGPGSEIQKTKVAEGVVGVATGQKEHQLNLDVALKLRDELWARGYSVVMVRETGDVNISNKERAELANHYGEQYPHAIFVRIHANSWSDPEMGGALTVCQSAENPFPTCVSHYEDSRRLSEVLLNAYCEATGFDKNKNPNREQDNMAGTNWCRLPTTIMEMGFLSNALEDRIMEYSDFWTDAAIGMANGIDAYFAGVLPEEETEETEETSTTAPTGSVAAPEVTTENAAGIEPEADAPSDPTDTEASEDENASPSQNPDPPPDP